jgi:hypothetical protein
MEAYGKSFGIFIFILRESFYHFSAVLKQVLWLIFFTLTISSRWVLLDVTLEKKDWKCSWGPHEGGGRILWKEHVLVSI